MDEILALGLDSSLAKRGADEFTSSATRVVGAATAMGRSVDGTQAAFDRAAKSYVTMGASMADFARAGASASQIAQLTGSTFEKARQAVKSYGSTVAQGADQVRGFKAAQDEMAIAGMRAGTTLGGIGGAAMRALPGINSVRSAMTAMAASALQTAPGVAQITSVLGSMAFGSPAMIGAIAGVAALTVAWRAWREEADKAKEEQTKLTDSLSAWYTKQKDGAAGEFPKQIAAMTTKLKELRKELDGINAGSLTTTVGVVGEGGSKWKAWARIFTAGGVVEMANQLRAEIVKGTAVVTKAVTEDAAAIVAAKKEAAKLIDDAFREAQKPFVDLRQQIDDQKALNAAYGQSSFDLERLALVEKTAADIREFSVNKTRDQIAAYTALADQLQAAKLQEIYTREAAALAPLANTMERFAAAVERAAAAVAKLGPQITGVGIVGPTAPKVDVNPTVEENQRREAARKYQDDVRKIWQDGTGRILTDGLKSYRDFFEDVLQLFSKLMDRMAKEAERLGKDLGKQFSALKYGSAAISGGIVGYQVGQQAGSAGNGALGGAAAGALAGSAFGPWGAAIGGIVGLTTGLIGGAKAARERAAAEEQLRVSLATSINAMRVQAGTATQLSQSLVENTASFAKLRADTEAAYSGLKNQAARESRLRELNDLEAIRIRQLEQEAAAVRANFFGGIDDQLRALQSPADATADAIRVINEQYRDNIIQGSKLGATMEEQAQITALYAAQLANLKFQQFSDANQAGVAATLKSLNDAQLAMVAELERQRDVSQAQLDTAQKALDVAKSQLDAQQRVVDETRQIRDSLRKYSDSLKLGSLSPLGDEERYNEARRQYDAIAALAAGGDKSAIASLPETANAFLEQSRAMWASSEKYVRDYQQVQAFVSALDVQYTAQLSVEEQSLAKLQTISDTLTDSVRILTAQTQVLIAQYKATTDYYIVGVSAGPHADPNFFNSWLTQNPQFAGQFGGGSGSGGGSGGVSDASGGGVAGYVDPYADYVWNELQGTWEPPSSSSNSSAGASSATAVRDEVALQTERLEEKLDRVISAIVLVGQAQLDKAAEVVAATARTEDELRFARASIYASVP